MRKREHFESYIEQAVYEVEMELIDLEDHGVTTKAQKKRAWKSIAILKFLAEYCRNGNYDAIERLDNPTEEHRKKVGI